MNRLREVIFGPEKEAFMIAFHAASGLLGMSLAHVDSFRTNQIVLASADAISSIFWSISGWVSISPFPQIAKLTLCTMWMFVPFVAAAFARSIFKGPTYREGGSVGDVVLGLVLAATFFSVAAFFPPFVDRPETQWIAGSKPVFLIVAIALMIFATVLLAMIYLSAYRIFKRIWLAMS